jgi:YVTN family beta-propeller protein
VLILLLPACQTLLQPGPGPSWIGEGEPVFVYLQPFPRSAERLRMAVAALMAERDDGTTVPLTLSLETLSGPEAGRQRLLASALLPPGEYRGLAVVIRSASVRTAEGEAALLVPEGPVPIAGGFRVVPDQALVVDLVFNHEASVRTGFSLTPVFSLFVPDRPVTGLTGLVAEPGPAVLAVFDKKKREVAGAIALAGAAPRVVLDERGRQAFAAETARDSVAVIDLVEGSVVDRLHLQTGDEPRDLALATGSGTLLVVNSGSSTVSFIDLQSRHETARLPVGEGPGSLVMDRDGRRAYVLNASGDSLSVIDVPNRGLAATVKTDPKPLQGALNRAGDRLYVICANSPYLAVLDVASLAVLRKEFIGMGAGSIKVDRRTDLIYLGRSRERTLSVYDPFSFAEIDRIDAGGPVAAMAIDGEEDTLFLVVPERRRVIAVNLVSRRTIGELDVSGSPAWITMMGER